MGGKRLTAELFIERAKNVENHKNKNYDYSKFIFENTKAKSIIICKNHGEFLQTPSDHLSGRGCYMCGKESMAIRRAKTTDLFVKQSIEVHGNLYDYSLVKYKNWNTNIELICKIHGIFKQTPNNHLSGSGCMICGGKNELTTKIFIEKSIKIHGHKYNYSESAYVNMKEKIVIICPKHGKFMQAPNKHLIGQDCPKCKTSKGEKAICKILEENNIKFSYQHRFNDCKYKKPLPFDFFLKEHNVCIEYDGQQHYLPYDRFGGNEALLNTNIKDKIKTKYCIEKNIKLIRISYENFNKIIEILRKNLGKRFVKNIIS